MTKARLVLLRHGQTADNIKRLDTGHNDTPLTETGRKQARAAGPLINGIRFDHVYSSPLCRALNTAELALGTMGTQQHLQNDDGSWKIEKRKEIIEIDDGVLTGRSMVNDPEVIEYFQNAIFDGAPAGGESEKQLVARVLKFYEEDVMPRLERGENVLVVAHVQTIRAFHVAMGLTPQPEDGKAWRSGVSVPNATPKVVLYKDGVLQHACNVENPETVKAMPKKKPAPKKKPQP